MSIVSESLPSPEHAIAGDFSMPWHYRLRAWLADKIEPRPITHANLPKSESGRELVFMVVFHADRLGDDWSEGVLSDIRTRLDILPIKRGNFN